MKCQIIMLNIYKDYDEIFYPIQNLLDISKMQGLTRRAFSNRLQAPNSERAADIIVIVQDLERDYNADTQVLPVVLSISIHQSHYFINSYSN